MTTRINITVDAEGLLNRNAQQQAATRQVYQQRISTEKAATEGQRQLEQERIQKGLDPITGEPSSSPGSLSSPVSSSSPGSSSRIRRIDEEPAANRRDKKFAVAWLRTIYTPSFNELGIYETKITYRLYSTNGKAFVDFDLSEGVDFPLFRSEKFVTFKDDFRGRFVDRIFPSTDTISKYAGGNYARDNSNVLSRAVGRQALILPAGGEGMYCIFRGRYAQVGSAAAAALSYSTTIESGEIFGSISYWTAQTITVEETAFVNNYEQDGEQTRAFFVNKTQAFEVKMPEIKFYSEQPALDSIIRNNPFTFRVSSANRFNVPFEAGESTVSDRVVIRGTLGFDTADPLVRSGIRYHESGNYPQGIVSNGLGDLTRTYHSVLGFFNGPTSGTPTAFKYLLAAQDDPTILPQPSYADGDEYLKPPAFYSAEYIYEADKSRIEFKQVTEPVTSIFPTVDTSRLRVQKTIKQPEFIDGWEPEDPDLFDFDEFELVEDSFITRLVAWDFDRPGFCLNSLNLLGFNSQPLN